MGTEGKEYRVGWESLTAVTSPTVELPGENWPGPVRLCSTGVGSLVAGVHARVSYWALSKWLPSLSPSLSVSRERRITASASGVLMIKILSGSVPHRTWHSMRTWQITC